MINNHEINKCTRQQQTPWYGSWHDERTGQRTNHDVDDFLDLVGPPVHIKLQKKGWRSRGGNLSQTSALLRRRSRGTPTCTLATALPGAGQARAMVAATI